MTRSFLVAVQFLTRLPLPIVATASDLAPAAPWYPLVGALLGLTLGALAAGLDLLPLAAEVRALLVIAASLVLTGALHEDGLADAADGFGGAFTREDALRIMRDSRIGSYGGLALVLLVGLRAASLSSMNGGAWLGALVVGGAAGRWAILGLMATLPYARAEGAARHVIAGFGWRGLAAGTALAVSLCVAFAGAAGAAALGLTAAVALGTGAYYRARLGGVTGDCLGATAALTETAVWIVFAAWHPATSA